MRTLIENGTIIAWVDNSYKIFELGIVIFDDNKIKFVSGWYDGDVNTRINAISYP